MNISSILGFFIAGLVIYFGVLHGAKDATIFLNNHALILVAGGTLAASLIAFPFSQLFNLADFLYHGVLFKRRVDSANIVDQIRTASQFFQKNPDDLRMANADHPFLAEGFILLRKNYLETDDLRSVLASRRLAFKRKYQQDAKVLNAIAKYPPAFGLLGASTGMIAMMTNLGGSGGTAAIGSSMAVALVATFWGITAANFVLLPLADHANRSFLRDQSLRELISEGLVMVHEGCSDVILGETLRSMLDTDQRSRVANLTIDTFSPAIANQKVNDRITIVPRPPDANENLDRTMIVKSPFKKASGE